MYLQGGEIVVVIDVQNPYLPANAQNVDEIPLTDSGEIKKLMEIRLAIKYGQKNKSR